MATEKTNKLYICGLAKECSYAKNCSHSKPHTYGIGGIYGETCSKTCANPACPAPHSRRNRCFVVKPVVPLSKRTRCSVEIVARAEITGDIPKALAWLRKFLSREQRQLNAKDAIVTKHFRYETKVVRIGRIR